MPSNRLFSFTQKPFRNPMAREQWRVASFASAARLAYRAPSTSDPRASTRSRKAITRSHTSSEDAGSYSGRSGSVNRWPEPG
jgi:hypothetical protein